MQHTIANMQEDNEMMRAAILAMRGSNSIAEERSASAMSNRSNVSLMLSSTKSMSLVGQNEGNMTQEITLSTEDLAVSKMKVNTATQTFDTAFVSCEACASMQQNLIDVGSAVISLCESQGLPSSLANQKKLLKKSIMAANDVSRWAMDQNRDIERINKHLDKLYQQIDPLRTDLEKCRMHCSMLKEQMKVLEKEKDEIETESSGKELEWKEKVETLSIKFFKEEKKLKAEILQLKVGREAIEKSLAKLKDDHVNQRKLNEKLGKYFNDNFMFRGCLFCQYIFGDYQVVYVRKNNDNFVVKTAFKKCYYYFFRGREHNFIEELERRSQK